MSTCLDIKENGKDRNGKDMNGKDENGKEKTHLFTLKVATILFGCSILKVARP